MRADPKRHDKPNTFEKEWSPQYGTCRHCGGKPWHRDCPRKPRKTGTTEANGRALNAHSSQRTPNADDVGAALFARSESASVSFT
eukprot:5493182-Pleurochrysis_carterae.AAC.1